MKNLAKILALGVFAASTTLVAHATPMAAGTIQFSDNCGTSCQVNFNSTAPGSDGSGNLVLAAPGTVTGPTGAVQGQDTFTYFDGSPSGAVTFYNTNTNSLPTNVAPTPASGTQTNFGPACVVINGAVTTPACGYNTSPDQPGAPMGGALIASIDENGELLDFYVTSEITTSANIPLDEVDLTGTGYFTETCDTTICTGTAQNYTSALATFHLDTGETDEITIDGSAATDVTPEPSSLVLLGTGLASAAGMVFRRRRSSIA
jgi:hypothetical protein